MIADQLIRNVKLTWQHAYLYILARFMDELSIRIVSTLSVRTLNGLWVWIFYGLWIRIFHGLWIRIFNGLWFWKVINSYATLILNEYLRAQTGRNPDQRRQLVTLYRAAQVLHTWGINSFRSMILSSVVIGETVTIFSLYVFIRTQLKAGIVGPMILSIGGMSYYSIKVGLEINAWLTDMSRQFCRPNNARELNKEGRSRLASCQPLTLVVGSTFTVTKATMPTISQDIILGNLINLLVSY